MGTLENRGDLEAERLCWPGEFSDLCLAQPRLRGMGVKGPASASQ